MKEVELAEYFVQWLTDIRACDHVYKEVTACIGDIDIVGKDGDDTIAVEVKTRFSFDVLRQAYNNIRCCNYSYIAVPAAKNPRNDIRSFQKRLCEMMGIGLLTYDKTLGVVEAVGARRVENPRNIKLEEYMKESIAGAPSSSGTKMTAFKITVKRLKKYVEKNPGKGLKHCVESIDHHYASDASAIGSLRKYIKRDIIKGIDVKDGLLYTSYPIAR